MNLIAFRQETRTLRANRAVGCRTSYSPYDLHHDFTLAGVVVKVHVDYLLPCPQRQATVDERDGERRSQESRAHVTLFHHRVSRAQRARDFAGRCRCTCGR